MKPAGAGRDQEEARKIASGLDGHAEAVSVDEAVDRAGVLVLAVWLDAFEQLIAQYGERLAAPSEAHATALLVCAAG
jgi:predicted dinucleotide-binding enzyme